eukprot:242825-Rhodomonas_salina.1
MYPCPAHSAAPPGVAAAAIDDCVCNAGYYALATGEPCEPCPTGFFCPGAGTVPQRCPTDAIWSDTGSTAPDACTSDRPPGPAG